MIHPRLRCVLLLSMLALLLSACGGAASSAVPTDGVVEVPPPVVPPTPPPAPSALDLALAAQLEGRDVATPPAPRAPAAALVTLGQALFFDKELSGNRNIACATCHHPSTGSGDDLSLPIGQGGTGLGAVRQLASGAIIPRNAPPLFNRGLPEFERMFWDSRVRRQPGGVLITPEPALNGPNPAASAIVDELDSALAAQAIFPLTSAAEMRGAPGENELADAPSNLAVWARIMQRLVGTQGGTVGGLDGYRALFRAAYPQITDTDQLSIGHVGRALAAFEDAAFRALNSPWDRYLAGDLAALTDDAKRGATLFYGRADCSRCHGGPVQTDHRHHSIAIPQVGPGREANGDDLGRFEQTGDLDDVYAFRTPTLRNVELTGPYMHDGAYTSLEAAIAHYDDPVGHLQRYDAGQLAPLLRPLVDRDLLRNQARADALSGILRPPPRLNPQDVADLAAFLRSLTDVSSRDLGALVPASVPSGLPVGD
ncbi:MAG: c-type cytochrome [Planctomycetota bacterium]|nr:c-type cytochrome [Planctomycetota bacterium]